jgi:hypothetical protein
MKKILAITLLLAMPLTHAAEKTDSKESALSSSSTKTTQEPKSKRSELSESYARVEAQLKDSLGNKGYLRECLGRIILATDTMFDERCEIMGNSDVNSCFDLWLNIITDFKHHKQGIDHKIHQIRIAALTKAMTEDREQLVKQIKQLEEERDTQRKEKLELQAALIAMATKSTATPATSSTASTGAGSAAFDCGACKSCLLP